MAKIIKVWAMQYILVRQCDYSDQTKESVMKSTLASSGEAGPVVGQDCVEVKSLFSNWCSYICLWNI